MAPPAPLSAGGGTISGDLVVTGTMSVAGTSTQAAINASGTVAAAGAVTVGTTLAVSGTSTVAAVNASGTVAAAGAMTVGTTLGVSGTSTMAAINASGTVAAAGAMTVGTTLGVTGLTTIGPLARKAIAVQTANYQALLTDSVIYMNGTTLTLTLPASPPVNFMLMVKNLQAASTLTVARNGNNINGAASDYTVIANTTPTEFHFETATGWQTTNTK